VQIGGETFEVGWSEAPEKERMEYWRKLQAAVPAYRMYRFRTEREIPIILLRRLPERSDRGALDPDARERIDAPRAAASSSIG
jgi:hypothetical protein